MHISEKFFCLPGLPLLYNIEGPLGSDDVIFIVGARPTTIRHDFSFSGQMAGLVITAHRAPPRFSACMIECLEDIRANTTGTSIISSAFNQQERYLQLFGPASPETFQSVLQSVSYINLAPDINVDFIRVEIHDGINSTIQDILISHDTMRRKREIN